MKKAKTILLSISPDNEKTPPGIEILTKVEGNKLRLKIICEKNIGSLIATLDDLLQCLQIAETTLEV
jgi:hypothetical protein